MIAVTNRKLVNGRLSRHIRKLGKAGIKAVQLREKDLSSRELLKLAREVKGFTDYLLVNERADFAFLAGAAGVHSTVNGLNPTQIKTISQKFITGKSVHSLKEALAAEKEGFDYIMFGPVYRTPAKVKYGKPKGIKLLELICKSVKIPVFAVGGIDPLRAEKCRKAGAHGAAVIRDLMSNKGINKKIADYKRALGAL